MRQPATSADDRAERKKLDLNTETISDQDVAPEGADAVKGGQQALCSIRRVE